MHVEIEIRCVIEIGKQYSCKFLEKKHYTRNLAWWTHARMSDAYTYKRRRSKEDDAKWKRMDDKESRCFLQETAKADID